MASQRDFGFYKIGITFVFSFFLLSTFCVALSNLKHKQIFTTD